MISNTPVLDAKGMHTSQMGINMQRVVPLTKNNQRLGNNDDSKGPRPQDIRHETRQKRTTCITDVVTHIVPPPERGGAGTTVCTAKRTDRWFDLLGGRGTVTLGTR